MDIQHAREQMIEQQIRAWEVLDPSVLAVMADIPRERFVPESYRELAFADTMVPLPQGQFMLKPQIEGRMLQALGLRRGEAVLEIGTGSGYTAACLAALGAQVTSYEIHEELARFARDNIEAVGVANVEIVVADGARLTATRRYDAIAVTGSVPTWEPSYGEALKIGGRLFVVVGEAPIMEALLVTRSTETDWIRESLFETVVPALENVRYPARFQF